MFNTHWDHISQPARVASGALMAKHVAARIARGDPVLVTGDFNAAPDNPAIAALTQEGALLQDSWAAAHPGAASAGTFHGFTGRAGTGRIDAVWTSHDWHVNSADIVRTADNGRYPSDHFPVAAVVELKPAGGPAGH
jgi:endonuclease/exonuclease/phosphatase family metal-dependent hydrolase